MGAMDELALMLLAEKYEKELVIDMTETLARGKGSVIACGDDGVLIYNADGANYTLTAENETALLRFAGLMREPIEIVTHNEETTSLVSKIFELNEKMRCVHCVYEKNEPLPEREGFDIRTLDETYVDFVMQNYSHAGDPAYIAEIIAEGEMLGAFVDGKPAGFIGVHREGSIGLLEILPEYRRHSLARELESRMINMELKKGHIPYCQVVEDNEASLSLQKSLGYTLSSGRAVWNFVK